MLDGLTMRDRETKKPARILLVLDESGQWIEDDAGRLAQLQALVEEAAIKGRKAEFGFSSQRTRTWAQFIRTHVLFRPT